MAETALFGLGCSVPEGYHKEMEKLRLISVRLDALKSTKEAKVIGKSSGGMHGMSYLHDKPSDKDYRCLS